jgi:hypothetical protein
MMIVDKVRTLEVFFEVYASNETKANVLSFTHVEDVYKIMNVWGEVHAWQRSAVQAKE